MIESHIYLDIMILNSLFDEKEFWTWSTLKYLITLISNANLYDAYCSENISM